MRFSMLLAATLAVASVTSKAESLSPPHIIVVMSVDQFSADLFAEYRALFKSGLRRLQTGAIFPNGFQSHAATETCPGHSTLLTGSHPARTGIIANDWYDQSLSRQDKKVYCAEDPSVAGSSSKNITVSAQFLKVSTLGDRMKAADARSRVVSVAGKDRAAIMMGGHAIDQVWFWSEHSFVTLRGLDGPAPAIVDEVNRAVAAEIGRRAVSSVPERCRSRAVAVNVADKTVGVPRARSAGDWTGFSTSLIFDRATTNLAIGLIRDLHLGAAGAPDILSVGLSATDYVGHTFGTQGAEMCAQLLGVDENVGRILAALDATRQPYVVVLTADHGGHDLPERNQIHGIPDAARVDAALLPGSISKQLAAEFHLAEPVLMSVAPFGDIYLSNSVPAALRSRVLQSARARYLAHPQVAAVFTAAELRRTPAPSEPADEWSLAERFWASFDPERSGDLFVAQKPHITPIIDVSHYVATHGSPWNYDRRVPIIFYQPGMTAFEQALPIETVDIMPTLAALIRLPIPPEEIDGRCIDLDAGANDRCAN